MFKFLQTVSKIYQGIQPKDKGVAFKRSWPELPVDKGEIQRLYQEYQAFGLWPVPVINLMKQLEEHTPNYALWNHVFTPQDVEMLKLLTKQDGSEQSILISMQDVAVALVLEVYNQVMTVPATTARFVLGVCGSP
jgi:hypothetical protein